MNELKKSKKLLSKLSKLTLTFMAVFMLMGLTGCTKHYTYLQSTEDSTLTAKGYKMQVPSKAKVNTAYNSSSYVFTYKDNEYIVNVSSNKAPTNVAKYIKKDVIRGYYTYDLKTGLSKIMDLSEDFSTKDNSKNASFEGYEGKKDTGTFKDANGKKYKFACYDFFIDEDKKTIPCEVFVASSTAKTKDLTNVAEEIISSIDQSKDAK